MSISALRPMLALALVGCAIGEPSEGAHGPRDGASHRLEVPGEAACDSAYATLCGPAGVADEARARRLAEVTRSIEETTLALLAPSVGLASPTREAWAQHLAAHGPERRGALRRLFRTTRAAEVERRIAPLRGTVEDELDQALQHARDAVAASDEPGRDAALARLGAARLAWLELDDPSPLRARALRRGCGDSLLVDDAWIDKRATSITLCPGFLLVSLDPGSPDLDAFRQRIAFLLAHEIGHVIVGPAEPSADSERRAEIGADRWATEILATELARIHDPAVLEAFLTRTLEPICSPTADLVHPSGPDRVERVAAHAIVADALGCGAQGPAAPVQNPYGSSRRITSARLSSQRGIGPSSVSVRERSSTL